MLAHDEDVDAGLDQDQLDQRWAPDEQLVAAAVGGSQRMKALEPADRAWVVAGLKHRGLSTERIGDLLHCSRRQVCAIAATDAGVMAMLYVTERETFAADRAMTTAELERLTKELDEALEDAERVRGQLNRLIAVHPPGTAPATFGCGCPRTRYNTYVCPKTGRLACREHRRQAVQRYRQRRRERVTS